MWKGRGEHTRNNHFRPPKTRDIIQRDSIFKLLGEEATSVIL